MGKEKRPILEVLCGDMEWIMKQIARIVPDTNHHGELQKRSFDQLASLVASFVMLNKILQRSNLNEEELQQVAQSTDRCKGIMNTFPEPVETPFVRMLEPFAWGIH